ncbi:MAG TPA: gamma-glutamyltransferase family protein [Roseiarcus sp.]|jgi:gamma-glutamyltranspeptidase/glutathione hydrolase|nr:gamma-glutamyltransferase family protein [Roseiarcus sp.]
MRNFELPGRSLAAGKRGVAATSHPTATFAAIEALRGGGNAVDAAVAACAVQCVVEAGSTGIGGDCFALLSRGGSADVIAYNGSGRTPAAATAEWYERHGVESIERHSPHAVTVPGAVEAWARLIKDHGRLTIGAALEPAIELARDGYAVSPRVSHDIGKQRDLLRRDRTASRIFLNDGEAPSAGALQRQPELAQTLEAIAREGSDAFYRGPIAREMVAYLQDLGGLHVEADFERAKGEYVTPITTEFRGRTIYECPPNGQGVIALMILKILSRFEVRPDPLDIDNLHIEIEAARLAYAARDAFLADPAKGEVPVDYLLSDRLADALAARIDLSHAIERLPAFSAPEHQDTVYIAVVDEERNAVSFINSLFNGYGSGLVSPNSGVLFHNRGQGFVLTPGHPNRIAPGKRPMHTIIPGMAAEKGRVFMPFGVMGGQYQAMGHAHLLSKLFDHRLDLQTAIDLPRLFPSPGTNVVEMEQRLRDLHGATLEARGFVIRPPAWPIGGAQAISIDWQRGTLLGASDPRKDGCALGF